MLFGTKGLSDLLIWPTCRRIPQRDGTSSRTVTKVWSARTLQVFQRHCIEEILPTSYSRFAFSSGAASGRVWLFVQILQENRDGGSSLIDDSVVSSLAFSGAKDG